LQHSAISYNLQGGTDTVTLERQAKDYTVSWSESDPYGLTLSSSKYPIKELHGIDQLNFQGDFLSEILHLGKSEFNVANGKSTRNDFVPTGLPIRSLPVPSMTAQQLIC
jgi:hypothetical protein